MNHTTKRPQRALADVPPPPAEPLLPQSLPSEAIVAQARELDETFKSLVRRVVVDDDPAADLPLRQLRVCMALYEGARSMSVLSRELGFSLSAMTQIADRLERAELVTRWFEGPDRRVRLLRLTPRARRMLRVREELRIRRVATVLEKMPSETREAALAALAALRQAANQTSPPAPAEP